MDILNLERTKDTPAVRFAPARGELLIEGESYPENSFAFYAPVLHWLETCLAHESALRLRFRVTYMNSSSTKCTFDLLDRLQMAFDAGKSVSVVWEYDADNPRALELAEDFREDFSFPFEILEASDASEKVRR